MVKLVDIDDTSLVQRRIGALPIVNQFLLRLGLEVLFDGKCSVNPYHPGRKQD